MYHEFFRRRKNGSDEQVGLLYVHLPIFPHRVDVEIVVERPSSVTPFLAVWLQPKAPPQPTTAYVRLLVHWRTNNDKVVYLQLFEHRETFLRSAIHVSQDLGSAWKRLDCYHTHLSE